MRIVERSHIGKIRSSNQDFIQHFLSKNGKVLFLVCDGMGGHSAGDVASKMAAVHFGNDWQNSSIKEEEIGSWISHQLKKENQRILEKAAKFNGLDGMGTTMVGAAESNEGWLVFNIGDSRAYAYINEKLRQITQDHSFVNELVLRGELTRDEAAQHPKKNVVTRSLGVDNSAKADFFEVTFNEVDVLLLCTDGLTNMVSDQRIQHILSSDSTLEQKGDMLLEDALEAGGTDNISFILVEQHGEGGQNDGIR